MDESRRIFLKIAGLSALGLGAMPAADSLAQSAEAVLRPHSKAKGAKRWAMVINLRKLKDGGPDAVQRCIDACHITHNVPEFFKDKDKKVIDEKVQIKWLWTEEFGHAFPDQAHETLKSSDESDIRRMPILVLCNHCDNPPCVRVCPTKATYRQDNGIVTMDMHRCIGCRYCMAACPFGARSLNWFDPRKQGTFKKLNPEYPTRMRGVVEKCTFCIERVTVGLQPACVEACKNKEIVFGDLEDPKSEVRAALKESFYIRRKPQLGTKPQVYYVL